MLDIILVSFLGIICIFCEISFFKSFLKEQDNIINKYMYYFCCKYNIEEDLKEINKL